MQSPKRQCIESVILDLPIDVLAHIFTTPFGNIPNLDKPPLGSEYALGAHWLVAFRRLACVCRRFRAAAYVAMHALFRCSPARRITRDIAAKPFPFGTNTHIGETILLMRRSFPIVKQTANIVVDDDFRSARGVFDFLFAEGDDKIPCRIEIRIGVREMTAFRAAFL